MSIVDCEILPVALRPMPARVVSVLIAYLDPVGNRAGLDFYNGHRIRYTFANNACRLTGEKRKGGVPPIVKIEDGR